MKTQNQRLGSLMWIGGAIALVAVLVAVAASWMLYGRTIDLLTQNLRERLLSISITEATGLSAEDINSLQVEQDWQKPEWSRVVTSLKKAKDSNPNIVFMYVFRKKATDLTQMEFVADAESINPYANLDDDPANDVDANHDGKIEPDGADKLQWPGQDYSEATEIPETFEAYKGPLTAKELYEDSYGKVLSGYAPITDASGAVVAILATDIKADDFFTVTQQTLYPFIIFIGVLIATIAFLSAVLIFIWRHRAETLARLTDQLELANRQQESLLHFISHEIKGYLTKGQNAFAGIVEGDYGDVPPKAKALATGALHEMRKGVSTVMDILDASNYKSGAMTFTKEPFDIKKAIMEMCDELRFQAEAKHLKFEFTFAPSGDYKVVGDEQKLRRHVIRNLVENSIHYTPNGKVTAALSKVRGCIRFTVSDTGVGITPEDMRKLFTQGGKGKDSIKHNVDSTGYGLFIAKQVTEAHGGRIWAESDGAGEGSTFIVELPSN